MSEPAIEARRLVRTYGEVRALDALDLRVPPRELYGLIGPNGSGKTTLIRILTGLERATSGEGLVLGKRASEVRKLIGYMPQEEALYPDLSILENVEFFAGLHGIHETSRHRTALEDVRMWDERERIVKTLSGGMRRRVSLAATLVSRPRILFLDEPTVGVDPLLRAELWGRFRTLAHEQGGVLITTHHMEEARRCDRVGLLWQGRLVQEGEPTALLERYGVDSLEDVFLKVVEEDPA